MPRSCNNGTDVNDCWCGTEDDGQRSPAMVRHDPVPAADKGHTRSTCGTVSPRRLPSSSPPFFASPFFAFLLGLVRERRADIRHSAAGRAGASRGRDYSSCVPVFAPGRTHASAETTLLPSGRNMLVAHLNANRMSSTHFEMRARGTAAHHSSAARREGEGTIRAGRQATMSESRPKCSNAPSIL